MGNTRLFYFFIFIETPYMKFILQSSDAPENCGFTRWVDPAPIDSVLGVHRVPPDKDL